MKDNVKKILLLLAFSAITACGPAVKVEQASSPAANEIIAVNSPLAYFTRQLAADLVAVNLPFKNDIDPSQWQPKLDDIIRLQQAQLIVLNGAGYSSWLDKVALASAKLIDTNANNKAQLIALPKQSTHSHGPEGEHSHSGYAFTTWMDMTLAKRQATAISDALIKTYPDHRIEILDRTTILLAQLSQLDADYNKLAKRLEGKTLFYSHPVYQYFQQGYNLAGYSFHWEPNEMPDEEQWQTLSRLRKNNSDALFIWEDQPNAQISKRMNDLDLDLVVIKPAANRDELNWFTEQQLNIERLIAVLN